MTLTKFNLHTGLDLKNSDRGSISFFIWLGLIFVLGTTLRSYMIADQIILDDEWHGITYVIGKPIAHFVHTFGRGDMCPIEPLSLFFVKNVRLVRITTETSVTSGRHLKLGDFSAVDEKQYLAATPSLFLPFCTLFLPSWSFIVAIVGPTAWLFFYVLFALCLCIYGRQVASEDICLTYIATGVFAVWFHLLAIPAGVRAFGVYIHSKTQE